TLRPATFPEITLMPLVAEPAPLMESPRRTTVWKLWGAVSLVMLMMIPATPALRIPPTPVGLPSMVIDLVMVTVPNPPGSRQSISPSTAVFEIAPANVLHGAVRLHGLASSPTPDTQVRVACAWAMDAKANVKIAIANALIVSRNLFIWSLLFLSVEVLGWPPAEHGSVPATVAPSLPIV